jgi:hypothetical protein
MTLYVLGSFFPALGARDRVNTINDIVDDETYTYK